MIAVLTMDGQCHEAAHLDVSKGHANTRQLDADVVGSSMLYQGDCIAARGSKLPQCCVLQNLHARTCVKGRCAGLAQNAAQQQDTRTAVACTCHQA